MENTNTSYELRLGKTTYIVCVKQAEKAKNRLKRRFLTSVSVRF